MVNNLTKVEKIVIIVTVIAVFMIFGGIGYAFFTMNDNTGSTAEITNTSGKMTITYADGGSNLLISNNIVPSDSIIANKTFTLTGLNTTTAGDGQIHYYIKKVSTTNESITTTFTGEANQTVPGNETYTGYSHGTLKNGNNKYTEMVTGVFPANKDSQTITFNLVLQFPDTGENQDTEKGKTINAEIEINHESVKATTFAEDSWDTIAAVVQSGNMDVYAVGSEKEVEIDGKSYTVRVANNTTPEECNGEDFSQTACGFVVEFVDIVSSQKMNNSNSNKGGWPASSMRTYANEEFFNKLPSEMKGLIIETKIISGHGSTSGETNYISTDKIYLLSTKELWNDDTYNSASSYTRQLDYYNANKVTLDNNYSSCIKKYNGSDSTWWLRTPRSDNTFAVRYVSNLGSAGSFSPNYEDGFAPAFRIG